MPTTPQLVPGRSCPVDYRYGAGSLNAPATLFAETLWIAGGLYGNTFALERLEGMFAEERGNAKLVFNGDFHWFDADDDDFEAIERGVSRHDATRGNVETELAHPGAGAGCGCGYPDWVGDEDVARSNRIIERLKSTASRATGAAARLAALPMFRVADVCGQRVAIVHGDAESLAGWDFSQEILATAEGRNRAGDALDVAKVDVFASSHTCLPVLQSLANGGAIANNGAAGMPNFTGTSYGIATRISVRPSSGALYRTRAGALHVEALAIDYAAAAWRERFLAQWPEGSDAHASYFSRIAGGPRYRMENAQRQADL